MAKKKTKKPTRRRRSRMSGIGGSQVNTVLGIAAGVVAGKLLTKVAAAKVDTKILGAGQIVAGIFLPKVIKGGFGTAMGYGLIANGGGQLLTSFGLLSGIDDGVFHVNMAGTDQLRALNGTDEGNDFAARPINGTDRLSTLNGFGESDKIMQEALTNQTRTAFFE